MDILIILSIILLGIILIIFYYDIPLYNIRLINRGGLKKDRGYNQLREKYIDKLIDTGYNPHRLPVPSNQNYKNLADELDKKYYKLYKNFKN